MTTTEENERGSCATDLPAGRGHHAIFNDVVYATISLKRQHPFTREPISRVLLAAIGCTAACALRSPPYLCKAHFAVGTRRSGHAPSSPQTASAGG